MKVAHIANVYFEEELLGKPFVFHPLLQYLPALYAKEGDLVVTEGVDVTGWTLAPWGFSEAVVVYAKKRGMIVPSYAKEAVKTVASKLFCFEQGFHLKEARIIENAAELAAWCRDVKGPKVLKRFYGMTGRGHYIFEHDPQFDDFPVIAEPFVKRELDFSTQWFLEDEIHFLGTTRLINNEAGGYLATRVGEELPAAVEEAKVAHLEILEKAHKIGFRGYCGIDAMIYEGGRLQPALEVNARRTMGQVALAASTGRFEIFFSHKPQNEATPLLPFLKKKQKQLWLRSF